MSSSVTQIQYWREVPEPGKKSNNTNASEGGPGAQYLSYNVFLGLSVLGGALALDHLYLRSPLTFLLKLILNVITLGTWWLYDATQAIFNRDIIKVYGLSIPAVGPKGIGAGCLASDVPDKKHLAFLFYSLALLLGGIFGLDSFLVGDKQSGFIRLICLITVFFAPLAIFWWIFNLFKFFFKTKDVTNTYWEYFGAPQPAEETMTILQKILLQFPFLQKIFGPAIKVKDVVVNTATGIGSGTIDLISAAATNPAVLITGPVTKVAKSLEPVIAQTVAPLTGVIETAALPVKQVVQTTVGPVTNTIKGVTNTAQTALNTAGKTANAVTTTVGTAKQIADGVLGTAQEGLKAASTALTLAPSAAALSSGLTTAAAQQALTKLEQKGGMIKEDSGVLPYVLVGTLGVIVVSGIVLTYRRLRQNEQPRKDDSPPEPGVPRKSDKEKSTKAT